MSKAKKGRERHYYLGNNTPKGFFSYYEYILGQKEAEKIICIKGGPGTGKSTFMRKVGEELLSMGESVDFLHCSADGASLDGIVIKGKKVAMVDGTSPHVVDPINPGAVDSIIHLGDYWNREGIQRNKFAIIAKNEEIGGIYKLAYNYLGAAGMVYNNIRSIMSQHLKQEEAYKNFAGLIGGELAHKEISAESGRIKKYFASAITAQGYVNFTDSIVADCSKVYAVETDFGVDISKMLELFADSAAFRGFDVEAYYCPMSPADRMEHLVVPELDLAIVTSNPIHNLKDAKPKRLQKIWFYYRADMVSMTEYETLVLKDSREKYDTLVEKCVECLKQAKKEHDTLESYYIPNMDFVKIEALRKSVTEGIL